jgi:hypothetical protein
VVPSRRSGLTWSIVAKSARHRDVFNDVTVLTETFSAQKFHRRSLFKNPSLIFLTENIVAAS